MKITVKIIDNFTDLEIYSSDWERLWRRSPVREIFTTFGWVKAAWEAFGQERNLCAPVVFRNGKVIGIFPLAVENRRIIFSSMPRSDYNDLICAPEDARQVLESALAELSSGMPDRFKYCFLKNLPEHSNIVAVFNSLDRRFKKHSRLAHQNVCPTIDLGGNERTDVLSSILKKKSLNRHRKKLSKAGQVEFRHVTQKEEILGLLPAFFEMHISRRAKANDQSLFLEEKNKQFYYNLVNEFSPDKELRFSVLSLDNRPVAFHLGFEIDGKYTWYKPAFDVNLWEYSPGEVLILNLFQYVAQKNLREFDFTVGDALFKRRFANLIRNTYSLFYFNRGVEPALLKIKFDLKQVKNRRRFLSGSVKFLKRMVRFHKPG